MQTLQIVNRSLACLKVNPDNARIHSKRQIRQLVDAFKEFGWISPVLIDENLVLIAGHARVEAAGKLELREVPTIMISGLTHAQKLALSLADNKIAANATWNMDLLVLNLRALESMDFEIELTGFATPEIDLILGGDADSTRTDILDHAVEKAFAHPLITKLGDCWILGGRHRILCADARSPQSFIILMAGKFAFLIIMDPPYNVPISGHVSGLGKVKHAEFAMACGEMTLEQFIAFLHQVMGHAASNSINGSLHYIFMDWAHIYELLSAGRLIYSDLKNICVWNKTNAGMGSLYRSKHELVAVFKHGKKPHTNNIELGAHGRYRTNVWDYAGVNTFKADRQSELESHPTVKPVAMIADIIRDCSKHRQIVLDPFMGSGTTLIAAELTGRIAYGMEIDPKYVDVAIRRWIELTGGEVRHAETGELYPALTAKTDS